MDTFSALLAICEGNSPVPGEFPAQRPVTRSFENRRQRNKVVALRKKSMARYFDHNCSKQDKSFWRTISPFFSDKKFRNGNHIILRENDNTIVDSGEITEVFNEYFSSVASQISFPDSHSCVSEAISAHQNHPSVIKIRDSYDDIHGSFDFRPVNHCEISRKLKMLNTRKSTGYDDIPAKLLRMAYVELASPISKLVNNAMKCAELSPIYKKDDNLLKNNFRPVSVLTGISKLESVVSVVWIRSKWSASWICLQSFQRSYMCFS